MYLRELHLGNSGRNGELESRGVGFSFAQQVNLCAIHCALHSFSEFVLRNPQHARGPALSLRGKAVSKSRRGVGSHGT